MRLRHSIAITLSGLLWMSVGIFLLVKGFSLLLHPPVGAAGFFLEKAGPLPDKASLALVGAGLIIGFLKGRFVLAKTARRIIAGIESLPNPCPIGSIYGRKYLLLVGLMVSFGAAIKFLPFDLRGVIDVAVGSALANGSAWYFRHFADAKTKKLSKKL